MPNPIPYDQVVGRYRDELARAIRDGKCSERAAWLKSMYFAEHLTYAYDVGFDEAFGDVWNRGR